LTELINITLNTYYFWKKFWIPKSLFHHCCGNEWPRCLQFRQYSSLWFHYVYVCWCHH